MRDEGRGMMYERISSSEQEISDVEQGERPPVKLGAKYLDSRGSRNDMVTWIFKYED